MTTQEFSGLHVLVTGGASGIGRAISTELLTRGADVTVLDLDVTSVPEGAAGQQADVRSRTSVVDAVTAAAEQSGGIDVVVNCAGVGAIGDVAANDDDEWSRVLDINVVGTARVSSAALPHLRRSSSAAIVNVCSVAALNGLPDRALYSASKGAVHALTMAMATDHVGEGIRVNCVSPATVHTPFVDRNLAKAEDPVAELAALNARQPIGRMVTPEEVAHAVAYLASPLQASTTGIALDVDGGMTRVRRRPA